MGYVDRTLVRGVTSMVSYSLLVTSEDGYAFDVVKSGMTKEDANEMYWRFAGNLSAGECPYVVCPDNDVPVYVNRHENAIERSKLVW